MLPWWEEWQGRLEAEVEAFRRRGWTFALDDAEFSRGRVVLKGKAPIGALEVTDLVVIYPDTFPHTRVAIYAPNLALGRHQNPFETNLCALPKASIYWRPSILAAELVAEQVPEIVKLARMEDPSKSETEYPQGEPVSAFFPSVPTGGFLIPEPLFDLSEGIHSGTMIVALDPDDFWLTELFKKDIDQSILGRGAIIQAKASSGTILVDDTEMARTFTGSDWSGRWVRLPEPPITLDIGKLLTLAVECDEKLTARAWFKAGEERVDHELLGFAFPEEVRQGVWETGWFFLVLRREGPREVSGRILRAMRYSADHLLERVEELTALRRKTVSVVGLGTLGAPICLQLAAGLVGLLRPMDFDFFDPATSVRWPGGVRAAGALKTSYLRNEIESQYPLTTVESFDHHLGAAPISRDVSERDVLDRWLQDSDLVIDATAEDNVSRVIAHLAHPLGIPQIYTWSVEGYGGVVALLRKGVTGCYLCLERALSEGTIDPPPAPSTSRRIQPRGCSDPTFVAPQIDLLPLSTEAVRFAYSTLSAPGGYPSHGYDVLVFSLRTQDGELRLPSFKGWRLPSMESCKLCVASQ